MIVDVERASGVTLTQPSPPRAFRGFLLRGALRPATPIEGEGFGTAKSYEVDEVDAITRARAFAHAAGQLGLVDQVVEVIFEAADGLVGVGSVVLAAGRDRRDSAL